jgi:hypothetical protein
LGAAAAGHARARACRRGVSAAPKDMLKLKVKPANFNSVNPTVVIASVAMPWRHRIHLCFVLRGSSAQAWYSRATSAVSSRLLLSDREQKCEITSGNGLHTRNIGIIESQVFFRKSRL